MSEQSKLAKIIEIMEVSHKLLQEELSAISPDIIVEMNVAGMPLSLLEETEPTDMAAIFPSVFEPTNIHYYFK